MFPVSLQRLLREWVALFAILAMVLGPLSLAVSRGLSAQERVNLAAGLASLPICNPADTVDGLAGKNGTDCDHCLPASGSAPAHASQPAMAMAFAGTVRASEKHDAVRIWQSGLPPATGPPLLI